MAPKTPPEEIEQTMQEYDKLLGLGLSRTRIAEQLNRHRHTLRKWHKSWSEKNYAALRDKLAEEVHEYIVKQKTLYSKSMLEKQYGTAAQVNDRLFERLQELGVIPKAAQKVELQGVIQLEEIWNKVLKKKS